TRHRLVRRPPPPRPDQPRQQTTPLVRRVLRLRLVFLRRIPTLGRRDLLRGRVLHHPASHDVLKPDRHSFSQVVVGGCGGLIQQPLRHVPGQGHHAHRGDVHRIPDQIRLFAGRVEGARTRVLVVSDPLRVDPGRVTHLPSHHAEQHHADRAEHILTGRPVQTPTCDATHHNGGDPKSTR